MRAPAIKLPAPELTPDQRAALERAKRPSRHPYRVYCMHQASAQRHREAEEHRERVAPSLHRLVR
ncbi:hypothetical protein [Stenotrophomonas geniculata]|uniref:hypothetical protein n=1 Tax=Stenotrophomonas geniculata TaxID=86188 RepID=UPI00247A8FF2|nr:hypothetical protein [Stenotrophomonas geniculata]MDH7551843.1 hypothetical protein [Stenotrophomonas geniculata]